MVLLFGITPAQAGKSARAAHPAPGRQDHPRIGGEKPLVFSRFYYLMGSPPRGRGKGLKLMVLVLRAGITPAWAGKRYGCNRSTQSQKDHPRVGGEKFCSPFGLYYIQGSPPRGRGKVALVVVPVGAVGITPRTGGEKLGKISAPNIGQGSPPHRRGKGAGQSGNTAKSRITPAWAGKSDSPPVCG